MTTMESPQIQVTSYEDSSRKVPDDDDDIDKELESFIATRKNEDEKEEDEISSIRSNESEAEKPIQKEADTDQKVEPNETVNETREEEKREEVKVEKEERKEEKREEMKENVEEKKEEEKVTKSDRDTEVDTDSDKVDSRPSSAMADRKEEETSREKMTDDEDSEPNDYTLTEDQKRALKEIEYLKSEMGLPEEDPPEYDVKERLKTLNEELANDPTPVEKSNSKIKFKANLVDLVAPPPDYPDEETPRENSGTPQSQEAGKENEVKNNEKKVLIECDGKFELVSENDVRAKDMGLPVFSSDKENINNSSTTDSNSNGDFNRKPAPPSQPRPATANGNSRRSRPGSSKQRASSAGTHRGSVLGDFNYNSPYAMSQHDKKLVEEQTKQREQRERERKQLEKQEKEYQERENNDAFQAWLRQKREEARVRKQREEEEKKKGKQSPRQQQSHGSNSDMESYESLPQSEDQDEQVKEAYSTWLKSKQKQQKQEKLLKKREEMESTDGFYIRSRQECDQAFRQWLRQKNAEIRKKRATERQAIKLQRLMARRSKKANTLRRAVVFSDAFRF
ncbi:coiled-coil domain-containing protein 181-like isoform X2 [Saccostrea cucullata]|uniref:coiled-coil domain-containing protein 181-like isoform X2 n=1 Tax=Saccostrea cuccullata TaxID=36930 RepID=UPI002ED30241